MIFKLHKKTDLALSALRHLDAAPKSRLTGQELADAIGTTIPFLPQVMSPLIRAGWVSSERGPGGGYTLTDESTTATLYDVIAATEGGDLTGRCVLRDAPCPGRESCRVHFVADEARAVLINGFREIRAIAQGARP
jgi:Rrf2 family iron-sulfur cluster assembly transcriptional regulator